MDSNAPHPAAISQSTGADALQAEHHTASSASSRHRWILIGVLIVLAGGVCRVRQFAARQSFWNDEAFIVLNVINRPARQLLGRLEYDQAAPPVFLWIERMMAVRFGASEYALRAQALICGIVGLSLFAVIAFRVLPPAAALCGIAFMAFCDKLVQYCVEVKQYSGDMMVATLLVLIALRSTANQSPSRRLLKTAIVASLLLWFSHTTAIIFGGISAVLLVSTLRLESRRDLLRWLAGNVLFAASLGALYFLSIRRQHTDFLYTFWAPDFPDLHRPLSWLIVHVYKLFDFPYPFAGGWVLCLSTAGAFWLYRRGKFEVAGFCLAPIALTAVAAFARQYPLNGSRLTLFLIPSILLLSAAGIGFVLDVLPQNVKWLGVAAAVPLLAMGLGEQSYRLARPRYRSHIRPAIEYVQSHRQPGDAVYNAGTGDLPSRNGSGARHLEILCYWPHPDPPFYMEWEPAESIPHRRFWLVFAFRPGQGDRLTKALIKDAQQVAIERDRFITPHGGAAFLFEKKD